jgi:hypothetical protein
MKVAYTAYSAIYGGKYVGFTTLNNTDAYTSASSLYSTSSRTYTCGIEFWGALNWNDSIYIDTNGEGNAKSGVEQETFYDGMSAEDLARYDEFWRKNNIGSEKTWQEYKKHNPKGNIDEYFSIINDESPWPPGFKPEEHIKYLKEGNKMYMAIDKKDSSGYIGGFSSKKEITSIDYVRNNLAVKNTWKNNPCRVKVFEVKSGVTLKVIEGPVGPQIDLSNNMYLPGDMNAVQYDLFRFVPRGVERSDFIQQIGNEIRIS